MLIHLTPRLRTLGAALALGALLGGAAWAEKADRSQQMVIEAERSGVLDMQRQVLVYAGNVVVSQGTLVLRADRIEIREMSDGYRAATAIGGNGKPASYKQKRDGLDETVEGVADRIEFDGRSETLRFVGSGAVRRLRGGVLADEITGALIVWDASAEVFSVEGGSRSATNPNGRVRAVLSPRADNAASAAAPVPLQPSRTLGDKR
jgi:lipopolysaccharide export system protein LptA